MPVTYEILVEGQLDTCWSGWLEGMRILPHDSSGTLLQGNLPDQAALYGLLNRLRDLNLKLVWMRQVVR